MTNTAPYKLHYTSEDYPFGGTWSVYVEDWPSRDAPEPIDGTQTWLSSHPSETAAEAEANRLQRALGQQ